ncbi:uncharacterized protein [Aegilops tauschii subsp. strangulata]|uniref:uncharacterized protein n=1 Tax=Aegilops tauschii subsp. strangulata TaxID=200361 RepID=UPI003CC87742
MANWSSLPSELVRRIADCLLDTNDLDCYVDFRAVCPNWRSATDDPKNSSELRFRPCRWIIVDEVFQSDSRLLVNIATGRAVRKDLPVLRNYHVVATTHGGFFVLADKETYDAVVLNPFTGHMIRFKVFVPSHTDISAAALSGLFTGKLLTRSVVPELRSSPTLILLSDSCYEQYMAVPDSDRLTTDDEDLKLFVLLRLAISGGVCAADGWQSTRALLPVSSVNQIFGLMKQFHIDHYMIFCDRPVTGGFADLPATGQMNHLFLVQSAGEMLAFIKLKQRLKVFRLDTVTHSDELEPVKSIGDRAIFAGYRMCISIPANKFPSVLANCIYYVKSTDSSLDIYQYDLKAEKEERVSQAIGSLNPHTRSFADPPFTIVQLLSSYTTNVRESQLHTTEMLRRLQQPASPISYLGYCSDSDLDIDLKELYY